MKVSSIRLVNFRSYADLTLSLDRLTVVRAPNGFGKTSIAMAIEYALTGRCEVTDQGGRGAEDLVRNGNAQMSVELNLGHAIITRSKSAAGGSVIVDLVGVSNFAGKQAEFWIAQNLAPVEVLSSVLNAYRFLEMKPNEQRALLAGALRADPVAIDPAMAELLVDCGYARTAQVGSTAEVDTLHKVLFEGRAVVNREIKALGDTKKPVPPADCPTSEAVRAKLDGLHGQRDALVKNRAEALAGYEASVREHTRGAALLAAAREQKKQNESKLLNEKALDAAVKESKGLKKAAELDEYISGVSRVITSLREDLVRLEAPIERACPTCSRDYDTLPDYSDKIASVKKLLTENEADLEKKRAARVKLGDPAAAQALIEEHQRAMPLWSQAERTIKELGTGGALPAKPDTTAIDAEIAAVDERIAKGNSVADRVATYEAEVRAFDRTAKVRANKEALSLKLDRLVEYFSDRGGLKVKLVGGKLPAFVARMNGVLERFGFVCELNLEAFNISVAALGTSTPVLKLSQLSESQRYRFGIAFQIALAETTGVGMVVVDRADMLQSDARAALTEELLRSNIEQAVLLATSDGRPLPKQLPAGVRFYELAWDSTTSVLHDTGATEDIYAAQ